MTGIEAQQKTLIHIRVNPDNQEELAYCSLMQREGFGTGIDPVELTENMSWIARNGGYVWLQYVLEDDSKTPTGMTHWIPLKAALKYRPDEIKGDRDVSSSPLAVIIKNQERAFQHPRMFAGDGDIIYHHGIAMARRGKGYGTLLLRHALNNTPHAREGFLACYIDVAKVNKDDVLESALNEQSFTVHMGAGFALIGIVEPPVYDNVITYSSFLRPPDHRPFKFGVSERRLKLGEPNAHKTLYDIRELLSDCYVGTSYDRASHEMLFKKFKPS